MTSGLEQGEPGKGGLSRTYLSNLPLRISPRVGYPACIPGRGPGSPGHIGGTGNPLELIDVVGTKGASIYLLKCDNVGLPLANAVGDGLEVVNDLRTAMSAAVVHDGTVAVVNIPGQESQGLRTRRGGLVQELNELGSTGRVGEPARRQGRILEQ